MTFVCVPGYKDVDGNKKADVEAKQVIEIGSSPRRQLPTLLQCKVLPVSIESAKR